MEITIGKGILIVQRYTASKMRVGEPGRTLGSSDIDAPERR